MASSENSGFIFTWSVENINYIALNAALLSPTFTANCLSKTEWRLGLVLRLNANQKIEKYLQLTKMPTEPYYYPISYELSIFDASGTKLQSFKVREFRFHRGSSTGESKLFDPTEYFSRIRTIECRLSTIANEKDSITEKGFGHTCIFFERRYFTWTIEKFSEFWRKTYHMTIQSKKCPSESIKLILNTSSICERKVQVELRNNVTCDRSYFCYCHPYPYVHDCEISVVDSKGNVMVVTGHEKWKMAEEYEGTKAPKGKNHDKFYFQFPLNSTDKELKKTCFQNDYVSFRCECDICFGFEVSQLENAPQKCSDIEKQQDYCQTAVLSSVPPTNFMEDMQQLLAEKQFCDFTLKTETESFPVHKAILSVRSPVFKAIFSHDMIENTKQSIDIPDLNANTIRRMLVYAYTDKVDNISWNEAIDLYIAGDKYQMLNLKERCSSILKSNLHTSNACEILVLADERYDEQLKNTAYDYILDHDVEIIRMDAWKNIEKTNPSLSIDILRQIAIKRQQI